MSGGRWGDEQNLGVYRIPAPENQQSGHFSKSGSIFEKSNPDTVSQYCDYFPIYHVNTGFGSSIPSVVFLSLLDLNSLYIASRDVWSVFVVIVMLSYS
jgi:hypothetical protein